MPNRESQSKGWTVGQLREALGQFSDDLLVTVCVASEDDDDWYVEYVVDGEPTRGSVDWGDGNGLVADDVVQINAFEVYHRQRPSN